MVLVIVQNPLNFGSKNEQKIEFLAQKSDKLESNVIYIKRPIFRR